MLNLTRYLFIKQEVELSLILSLSSNKNLDAALYWTYELYYSGYEDLVFSLLEKIYYDYYYLEYPYFESYVKKKKKTIYSDWKSVGHIVKNLYLFIPHPLSLELNWKFFTMETPSIIFKGRCPKWLLDYPEKYRKIFRYLKVKEYSSAMQALTKVATEDYMELHSLMNSFLELDKQSYQSFSSLIQLIVISEEKIQIREKKKYVTLNKTEIDDIEKVQNDDLSVKRYNLLKQKYKFPIDCQIKEISGLIRNDKKNYVEFPNNLQREIGFHWLYHCIETPLWKKRFDKMKVIIDEVEKKIVFPDDDLFEDFMDRFEYEYDEQSLETKQFASL